MINSIKSAAEAAVKAYISETREQIVKDLCGLCRIPSVKDRADSGNPYGKNVADALCAVKSLAEENGLECKIAGSRKYALAKLCGKDNGKTIGIFSHCDVVPANADEWSKTAPFEPTVENGYIFCRGCGDNKASAVAAVHIAKMIKNGILPVKSSMNLYFGGNEEAGMDDIDDYTASNEKQPDICLVTDNGYPVCIGEKGIARITVKAKKPFEQILSFDGGIAVNAVIGTLAVRLKNSSGLYDELCGSAAALGKEAFDISSDGDIITVIAKGKSAHAARPDGTVNAAVLAAKLLCGCETLCENDKKILKNLAALAEDYHGGAFGIDFTDEKFGRTSFVLGKSKYVRGEALTLQFDIRFGIKISAREIESRILSVFSENEFSVNVDRIDECYVTNLDKKYIDAVTDVYKRRTGKSAAEPYYSAGGTYARKLKNAVSLGLAHEAKRPKGLSDDRGGAHQPDECLNIDAYLEGIITNSLILLELDNILNN